MLSLEELTNTQEAYIIIDPDLHCWAMPVGYNTIRREGRVKINDIGKIHCSFWYLFDSTLVILDTVDYGKKWSCEKY